MTFKLSVLDQSPIARGHTPGQALRATIELAQSTEALGYHRYWLAEHHNLRGLADPCPEILLGQVAAATRTMRVGTGGVLLPFYSPLKVAEVFRMYEALFPGRIDLGIGRVPVGDKLVGKAMNARAFDDDTDDFPAKVQDVVGWLDDRLARDHPFAAVKAMPAPGGLPQVWLLGSSNYSGALASHLGLRFAFAQFISPRGGEAVAKEYRNNFSPSARESSPYSLVCVYVLCAETEAQAERLATSVDHHGVLRERAGAVIGAPGEVKARLIEIREAFAADELMVITITGDYEARLNSYRLLAEAFQLAPPCSPYLSKVARATDSSAPGRSVL
jgi:luciferase family oxidoreductase group 1